MHQGIDTPVRIDGKDYVWNERKFKMPTKGDESQDIKKSHEICLDGTARCNLYIEVMVDQEERVFTVKVSYAGPKKGSELKKAVEPIVKPDLPSFRFYDFGL